MRVLLVKPGAPARSPFFTNEKRFPIGIGFLISVLRNAGHEVHFVDNYLRPHDFIGEGYLQQNKIEILGLYMDTICLGEALLLLKNVEKLRRRKLWNGRIVVGGPHASVLPHTVPDFVDHIVIGEGERALLRVIEGVQDRIVKGERIREMDSLPMPAYDVATTLPYDTTVSFIEGAPVFTMNTSRGCPFDCTFCSVGSVWGRRYDFLSAARVVEDIEFLKRTYNAEGIFFREDNFTLRKKRVFDFCERLLGNDVNIKWMCETRVDTLDKEMLRVMKRAGCEGLYIGAESGSQRVLDFLKKGITTEQVKSVFAWCAELGIKTLGSFVVGVPTETPEERKQTVEFARELGPTTSAFNVFVGIPTSTLYDYVLANRLYEHIDEVGLLYMKGHDALVDEFYSGHPNAKIPKRRGLRRITYAMARKLASPGHNT